MKTSHFAKFILITIVLYAIFFTGSYWQKAKLTQSTQKWLTSFKIANPAIKSITFKNANTNLFSAILGHYKITGIEITFKAYPKNPLNIGRLSVKQFNQKGFKLRLDDIFIKNLQSLMNKPKAYAPLLNIDLNYQRSKQLLFAKVAIFNQLIHLQTRSFRLNNIKFKQPIHLPLNNNPWIYAVLNSKNVAYNVKNNPKQNEKSSKWLSLIPQEGVDLLKAYKNSKLHALHLISA